MDLLSLSDKKPANSPTICHTDSKLGEINHISSVECHSSELLHRIADVSDKVSFDNDSNSISSSSDLEICNYLNFYFNENDAALDFNSIMGISYNTSSTASDQLNHYWDMNMLFDMDEMNKLFPFQEKGGFNRHEEAVDEINKKFPCQNYADSTVSYQSSQYKSHHQDIDIFLNMDELNKQYPLQNSGMGWDDTVDGTRLYLPMGTEVASENGIGIEIGRFLEDIKFGPEELPYLMEINSVLDDTVDGTRLYLPMGTEVANENGIGLEIGRFLEDIKFGPEELPYLMEINSVLDDTLDGTRLYLPMGTEVANENGIGLEIGRFLEDIKFGPEELPYLMEINSVLDDTVDGTRLYLPMGTDVANENGIGLEIGRFLEDIEFCPEELPSLMEINSVLERRRKKRITLVLDLDETLVHSMQEKCYDANFVIMYGNIPLYVKERPYLQYFVEKVAGMFEIVIFTAGLREYASKVLDKLDPEGKFFSRRFYRDSCTHFMEGGYVKDLTILGVDLAKVAIIDNLPKVYRLQKENGIPIKSWYDDQSDDELIQLLPFLETLVEAEDVRPLISKKFNVIG